MALERTFSIIKPDATARNLTGKVNAMIEGAGLRIIGQRRIQMTEEQAKRFYAVHADRDVMGATNPADAAEGTIRKEVALSIGENSVHGSDSAENAAIEIAQFFSEADIAG